MAAARGGDNVGAAPRELLGYRATDATRCARHDRNLSVQLSHATA
jgi:hypothetical protein